MRYTDPTGHFTDDALQKYLKKLHGDDWERFWKAWLEDQDWMDLLHAAEGGDTLALLHEGGLWHYLFSGKGQDLLDGIAPACDIVGTQNGTFDPRLDNLDLIRGLLSFE